MHGGTVAQHALQTIQQMRAIAGLQDRFGIRRHVIGVESIDRSLNELRVGEQLIRRCDLLEIDLPLYCFFAMAFDAIRNQQRPYNFVKVSRVSSIARRRKAAEQDDYAKRKHEFTKYTSPLNGSH